MAGTDSSKRRRVKLDTALFGEREAVQVRRDLVDCQILVCSLEVLVTFSDNFDYQARLLAAKSCTLCAHRTCEQPVKSRCMSRP